MKKSLVIALAIMGIVAGCEKEFIPATITEKSPLVTGSEKANTKRKIYCNWQSSNGTILAHGNKCTQSGDDCGRDSRCILTHGTNKLLEENTFIEDGLSLYDFIEYTQTEEGAQHLYALGYHDEDDK